MNRMIQVLTASTKKLDLEDRQIVHNPNHVRLYSETRHLAGLQIRTEGPITHSGRGKSHKCYSHATLNVETATKLRDALNEWLETQEKSK